MKLASYHDAANLARVWIMNIKLVHQRLNFELLQVLKERVMVEMLVFRLLVKVVARQHLIMVEELLELGLDFILLKVVFFKLLSMMVFIIAFKYLSKMVSKLHFTVVFKLSL